MAIIGTPMLYGFIPELSADDIVNLPASTLRVKIRYRPDSFVTAFVKTPAGVFKHYLQDTNGAIALTDVIEANLSSKPN